MYYDALKGNLPLLLFSLALVYVASSLGEEIVYRGFLVTRLSAIFGGKSRQAIGAALVLCSVVFGLAHFQ